MAEIEEGGGGGNIKEKDPITERHLIIEREKTL